MRQHHLLYGALLLACASGNCGWGQAPSAQNTLANAAAAFLHGATIHSVSMHATAEWIAGSVDETGSATLVANADGSFSLELQMPQHARTETQAPPSSGQGCTWSGADSVSHLVSEHNCMTGVAWFLPAVAIFGGQRQSTVISSLIGPGMSQPFLDLRQQQSGPSSSGQQGMSLLSHLSTVDLYLDPGTYQLGILSYNIHPDKNAAADISVQVTFTNYQVVDGIQLPFRIQRYMNGQLNLDITVTQASTN